MPEIFLDNAEVLGAFVAFAGVAAADLVRGDPVGSILLEGILDRTWGGVFSLLPEEKYLLFIIFSLGFLEINFFAE